MRTTCEQYGKSVTGVKSLSQSLLYAGDPQWSTTGACNCIRMVPVIMQCIGNERNMMLAKRSKYINLVVQLPKERGSRKVTDRNQSLQGGENQRDESWKYFYIIYPFQGQMGIFDKHVKFNTTLGKN